VSSDLPLQDGAGYWSDCTYFIKQLKDGKIKTFDSHSAVAFFFGLTLQQELKVPVAVIDSSWGGTRIEQWIADDGYEMEGLTWRKLAENDEAAIVAKEALAESIQTWRVAARESLKNGAYVSPDLKAPRSRVANAVYNGMIAPLVPYAIKGVVWYQGESNRESSDYFEKLRALTGGWSTVFGAPDLPFYLVQVAPYNYALDKT
jgi:sialate O-acetylesterase